VPLPARACPAPCSRGYEQSRDLTDCARSSPQTSGRDLAGAALADLPVTRPGTVRPHLGLYGVSGLFSNLVCELRAPLRNRTVDLLLTMHGGFVRWHRVGSGYCRPDGYLRLGPSRCVCRRLGTLSLSLSLARGHLALLYVASTPASISIGQMRDTLQSLRGRCPSAIRIAAPTPLATIAVINPYWTPYALRASSPDMPSLLSIWSQLHP